jgi:hypothetical protein
VKGVGSLEVGNEGIQQGSKLIKRIVTRLPFWDVAGVVVEMKEFQDQGKSISFQHLKYRL